MQARGPVVALVAAALIVAGCGSSATPGEMSAQTYRSLDARDDLTPEVAQDRGAVEDEELARTFLDEGGSPAPSGATCLYAETSYRTSYRGVARFCFVDGEVVSSERNRADLDQ